MHLRVKEWRKQRGLSQRRLALCCAYSRETISGIETGRTTPSTLQLIRIADSLHVHICELLEGEDCPHGTDDWRSLC